MTSYEIHSIISDTIRNAVDAYSKSPIPLSKTESAVSLSIVFYFTVDLTGEELVCSTQAPMLLQTKEGKLHYEPYTSIMITIPYDPKNPMDEDELDEFIEKSLAEHMDTKALREGILSTQIPE